MRRRIPRLLPTALPERGALAVLLVAWLLGVVAPAFHDHADHDADAAAHDDHDDATRCSGVIVAAAPVATLAADCPEGEGCRNPVHHHHSHELPRHDVANCPTCAALLQRAIVPVVSFSLAPRAVHHLAPLAERASLPSERSVFAQARGPPSVARLFVTRDRSSSTAALRA